MVQDSWLVQALPEETPNSILATDWVSILTANLPDSDSNYNLFVQTPRWHIKLHRLPRLRQHLCRSSKKRRSIPQLVSDWLNRLNESFITPCARIRPHSIPCEEGGVARRNSITNFEKEKSNPSSTTRNTTKQCRYLPQSTFIIALIDQALWLTDFYFWPLYNLKPQTARSKSQSALRYPLLKWIAGSLLLTSGEIQIWVLRDCDESRRGEVDELEPISVDWLSRSACNRCQYYLNNV